jgi:hypothetical protein
LDSFSTTINVMGDVIGTGTLSKFTAKLTFSVFLEQIVPICIELVIFEIGKGLRVQNFKVDRYL